jgi:threonyl-tRNA synthetase
MGKIVAENADFIRLNVSLEEAKKKFKDNTYKLELIKNLRDQQYTIYQHGKFFDLCRGPHVPNSSKIKAFKLTKVAGAYWRGDAKNRQLQRIYGIAFPDKKELREYLELLKEADKRDHRKLGRELEIFSIHEEGPGFPFFLPKGIIIKNELVQYWREIHRKAGYVEIQTPIMLNRALWECSGHWANYRQNMYLTEIDGEEYAIKPMNCPGGMLVYKEKVHSYKELPMRVGEIGVVHRHELSGVVTGLFRVRVFTQDDAHIFMREEQIKDEIKGVMKLMEEVYGKFGFSYHVELSTRPEKSIGTNEQWEHATHGLKSALDETGFKYKINEGDGAFYGPKIDYHLKDCIGRTWQCGTIQLDMSLPERFALTYMDKDGRQDKKPVMIHRVVFGSIERFMGILIEHFAGKFPLWLSPVHARVLTISDRFESYAKKIYQIYFDAGLRVEVDLRTESIGKKVRDAQNEKIPLILTAGEKEEATQTLAVRTLDGKIKFDVKVAQLLSDIKENIGKRDIRIGFV